MWLPSLYILLQWRLKSGVHLIKRQMAKWQNRKSTNVKNVKCQNLKMMTWFFAAVVTFIDVAVVICGTRNDFGNGCFRQIIYKLKYCQLFHHIHLHCSKKHQGRRQLNINESIHLLKVSQAMIKWYHMCSINSFVLKTSTCFQRGRNFWFLWVWQKRRQKMWKYTIVDFGSKIA